MKKLLSFLFAATAVVLLSVSCRHKIVRDECRALVDEINDSVLVGKIDGSKIKFDVRDASFTHGAVMYGDSVIIHYIGDLSMKRALAESVFLLDRPGKIIEVPKDPAKRDKNVELLTRPSDPSKRLRDEEGVKAAELFAK